MRRMKIYIHEQDNWPYFKWDNNKVLLKLGETRNQQGKLLGKMETLGFDLQNEAVLNTLTLDVIKSSEIEGEFLEQEQVRSSIARRLGLDIAGSIYSERNVDGIVEMMLDATQRYSVPLTKDRLFDWHAALFPTGRTHLYKITVADWRKEGPMQVVSGPMGKEKIHYEAPHSERVAKEMDDFLYWFENEEGIDLVLKAAIAHLWFVTIHPFDDGNGRIARAIADSQLARTDRTNQRFYSISAQIMNSKSGYYNILESSQKGNLDVSQWLVWYFERLTEALEATNETLSRILVKAKFWESHKTTQFNKRQIEMINKLQGDFFGKLNSSKWAKMTKVHRDTARRDIQDLIEKGVLSDSGEGGRSIKYNLILPTV